MKISLIDLTLYTRTKLDSKNTQSQNRNIKKKSEMQLL